MTDTKRAVYMAADMCPDHGFGALMLMTLDAKGFGSGTRIMGPKSCCPRRQEVMKWRVTTDDIRQFAAELALEADAIDRRESERAPEKT